LKTCSLWSIAGIGAVVLAVNGCASTYKASENGPLGAGYSEKLTDDGTYLLRFNGRGNENVENIMVLWHRRAAELCGENNYSGTPREGVTSDVVMIYSVGTAYPEQVDYPYVEGNVECRDKQLAHRTGPAIYNPADDFHKVKLNAITAPDIESGDQIAQNFRSYINIKLTRYGSDPTVPGKYDMNIVVTRFIADGWQSHWLLGEISGGTFDMVSVVTIVDTDTGQIVGQQEISTEVSAQGESEYRLKEEHALNIVGYAMSVFTH